MLMSVRRLVLATGVLAILCGLLFWSQHHKTSARNSTLDAAAPSAVITLDPSSIEQLTVHRKDAQAITLVKAPSGQWQIRSPQTFRADQDTVSSMLSALSPLVPDRILEDHSSPAALAAYGIRTPALEVDIQAKNKAAWKLLFGDTTPSGSDVYAMLSGDPRLFTIASYVKSSLDKDLDDLRDKHLLDLNADKVRQVELHRNSQDIVFVREKQDWQIVRPRPLRTDTFAVDNLVSTLTGSTIASGQTMTSANVSAKFAQAAPVATVTLITDTDRQTLEVRKEKDNDYARSSVLEGAYKVDAALGQAVEKALDDFRSKKLFDFGEAVPEKIEIHDGAKDFLFTRNGSTWSSGGKSMDSVRMGSLVEKLRDLTASKLVHSGFTRPEIELSVTSDGGKRVERIQIATSGKDDLARRQGEDILYQLDASSITDILSAASDTRTSSH